MKKNIHSTYRLGIVLLFLLFYFKGWTQVAAWDFYSQSNSATFSATTFDSGLISAAGASNIIRGTSATASSAANSFRTEGFKNDGISLANTDYFQVTLTAAAGHQLSLSTINARFGGTASFYAAPGVSSQFAYSLDGVNFTLIDSPIPLITLTMPEINLTGITSLQNVGAGTTITLRYYASGQTSTGGWGFQSGNTVGTNGLAIGGTVIPAGKVSNCSVCAWDNPNTWLPIGVPTANDVVTIRPTDIVYNTIGGLVRTAATNVLGSFQIENNSWVNASASGAVNFNYGTTGTLIFNANSSYGVNSNDLFWPYVNGPVNVNVLKGGFTLNNGTTRLLPGNLETAAGINIASGENLTINGTLKINQNGFFGANSAPIYGAASTLIYNTGSSYYDTNIEWNNGASNTMVAGKSIPHHVIIQNSKVNLTDACGLTGDLTIVGDAAELRLNASAGKDLYLKGNFSKPSGLLIPNNRAIFFVKNGTQTVSSSASLTLPYVVFAPASGSTTLQLSAGTNLNVAAPVGGNAVSFSNALDLFDINGQSLSIGSTGQNNTVSGTGSFKGSATSNFTLLGNGSIGTLNITGGLNNFTINRQANSIAAVLGNNLLVNGELKLSNGILDLNNWQLTSAALGTITNASSANYIIADKTKGGSLRKNISAIGTYNFPIGDATSSADGSQYSPAMIHLSAANLSAAYLIVNVEDSKHPNNEAATDFISRYWNLNGDGITSATYNFTATYLPIDVNGTETNSVSGRYANGNWTSGSALASSTLNVNGLSTGSGAINLNVDSNQFSAGSPLKKPKINIKGNGISIPNGSTVTTTTGNYTDFGSVISGVNSSKVFVIENIISNTSLTLGNPAVALTDGSQGFSVSVQPAINPMTGNTSQSITILFNKVVPGIYTDIVRVSSNDPDSPVYTFKIQATVPQPTIAVTKTLIIGFVYSFGQGPSASQSFVVNGNNLGAAITIVASSNWEISTNQTYDGGNVAPWSTIVLAKSLVGQVTNRTIYARLKDGLAIGAYTGTVTLTSPNAVSQTINLSGEVTTGLRDIKVTGNGTSIINGSITPLGLNNTLFASQNLGESQTKSFEIKNLGGESLTIGTIIISGVDASSFSVLNGPIVGTILNQNDTANFQIKFAPTTIGTKNANVTIASNDPDDSSFIFAIRGGATYCSSAGDLIIARQDFETTPVTPVMNYTLSNFGAILPGLSTGFSTGKSLNTDAPKTNNLYSEGVRGYRVQGNDINGEQSSGVRFTFDNVDTSSYSNISLSFKVAGFSLGSNANGMDHLDASNTSTNIHADKIDFVLVEVSPDGGATWYQQAKIVSGELNLAWSFGSAGTTTGTRPFMNDNNITYFNSTTTNRYSGITITNLPAVTNLRVRISAQNNSLYESWILDDIRITSTGLVPKVWNGSVWLPSAPQSSDKAIINGNYHSGIDGGFKVCQCEINNSASLTVAENTEIKVSDFIINNGTVVVESDANFIQVNEADTNSGAGVFKVLQKLNLSTDREQYNYMSSPIENTNLKEIYKDGSGNPVNVPMVLYHNEATNKFLNSSGNYIKGRALAVKEPAIASFASPVMNAVFTGQPANGSFIYNLVNSDFADHNRGYNLIGNPYPSNIDLIKFYADNSATGILNPTFYFWDNKANTQTVQMGDLYDGLAYANFNAATPTGVGTATKAFGDPGAMGLKLPTRYVKVAQGFMAKIINTSALSVRFNNSIRKADPAEAFFGKPQSEQTENSVNRYWLNLITPAQLASNIAVVYFAEGNDAFSEADSRSMGGSDAFYSIVDGEKVSINGKSIFNSNDKVELGTAHFSAGIYTIAIDRAEGIFENDQHIYLKDHQAKIITNLSEGNYSFEAGAGETTGRFEIVYQPETVLVTNTKVKEEMVVYRDQDHFIIKSPKTILTIQVYDSSGKLMDIIKPNAKLGVLNASKITNGIYILKITTKYGEITSRKIAR